MNVFTLKLIALITMMIDHYGAIFQNGINGYRIVGRLAFPIYAFILVEGYFHTSDVKKYAKRLLLFAFISEIPFDLAFYGELEFKHQNIFFTLFIGLMTMYFIDNSEKYKVNKFFIILISILLATGLSVDYSFVGVIYVIAFYFTRDMPKNEKILRIGIIIFLTNLAFTGYTQQFSLFSLPFIYIYNGELGAKNKVIQNLFYIMYPMHLLLFYAIGNL